MAIPTIPSITTLPLILAGPIVRRVTRTRVAVWVATRASATVQLQVLNSTAPAVTTTTAQIGQNLHVALADLDASSAPFDEATIYVYNLTFSDTGSAPAGNLKSAGIITAPGVAPAATILSYPALNNPSFVGLPSFVIPQSDLTRLRLCQASCRKPHADSVDMLAALDADIASTFSNLTDAGAAIRPQQLFLTGDQIYADDVADSLMALIQQVAATFIGNDPLGTVAANDPALKTGFRAVFVHDVCKFTSDPEDEVPTDVQVAKNHLLRFSEFCAMYLLTLSPALWPTGFPAFSDIYSPPDKFPETITRPGPKGSTSTFDTPKFRDFKRENAALTSFLRTLPAARRALANVATFMVLDDHEVADDFYINRLWVTNIAGSDAGKSAVRNGLLTYGIFQAWGNVPNSVSSASVSPYQPLVDKAKAWFTDNFSASSAALTDLAILLRLPTGVPVNAPFDFTTRADLAPMVWNFRLSYANYEVIALDMRTRRLYPGNGRLTPAALISDAALKDQIPDQPAPSPFTSGEGVTIVITPGPWASLPLEEGSQRSASTAAKVFDGDVELLHFDAPAFDGLVAQVAARRNNSRVLVFCGDIHHAFGARIQYWSPTRNPLDPVSAAQDTRATFAHLISSAIKNQDISRKFISTLAAHYAGFRGNIRDVTRLGWRVPTAVDFLRVGTASIPPADPTRSSDTADWDVSVTRNQTAVTELDVESSRFETVTPERAIDWRMHRVLFAGDPKGATTNPISTGVEILIGLILLFFEWLFGYVAVGGGGKEVVGVNNIGFIKLHWGAGDDKQAIQELRWFSESYDKLYAEQAKGDDSFLASLTNTTVKIPLTLDPMPPAQTIILP